VLVSLLYGIQILVLIFVFSLKPPTVVNLDGAKLESETVTLQRYVMSYTCTDTVQTPTSSISVSPSTNPEFFRAQVNTSSAGSTGRLKSRSSGAFKHIVYLHQINFI